MNLRVRVQPRATRNALKPWQPDEWKLFLTAPPVDGKANEACIEFFARGLGIARSRVRIVSGHTARQKVIALESISEADVRTLAGISETTANVQPTQRAAAESNRGNRQR
ncbi:MAG: DUF167 domain-containing protein [Acidobacteria bacterium]|nr:DUF167 domain-containing protein [Acidobacteriota bacterium]